jgi:hypothetical protein
MALKSVLLFLVLARASNSDSLSRVRGGGKVVVETLLLEMVLIGPRRRGSVDGAEGAIVGRKDG